MSLPSLDDIRTGLKRMNGLSPALREILPRLGDAGFEADELAHLLSRDPLLTARVLHLANSPFYGLSRRVGSLREAVLVLGFSSLRGLVLSAGLINALSAADAAASRRSLAVAAAAGALAKEYRLDQGMASTAGLLHNLGALLLAHFSPEHWQSLGVGPDEPIAERLARERGLFGFDQCQLAAELAVGWCFPAAIPAAIRHYPVPPDQAAEHVTDLVHAAWVLSAGAGVEMTAGVIQRLGLETPPGKLRLAAARQAMNAD